MGQWFVYSTDQKLDAAFLNFNIEVDVVSASRKLMVLTRYCTLTSGRWILSFNQSSAPPQLLGETTVTFNLLCDLIYCFYYKVNRYDVCSTSISSVANQSVCIGDTTDTTQSWSVMDPQAFVT